MAQDELGNPVVLNGRGTSVLPPVQITGMPSDALIAIKGPKSIVRPIKVRTPSNTHDNMTISYIFDRKSSTKDNIPLQRVSKSYIGGVWLITYDNPRKQIFFNVCTLDMMQAPDTMQAPFARPLLTHDYGDVELDVISYA